MHDVTRTALLLLALAPLARGIDHRVATAAELESAVRRAAEDDRILLAPGVYELTGRSSPTLRLPAGVDLIGPASGRAVVTRSGPTSNDHRASGALIGTSGGQTTLANLVLLGVPSDIGRRESGLLLSALSGGGEPLRARVEGCRFEGLATAISVQGYGNEVLIEDCSFADNRESIFTIGATRVTDCDFTGAGGEVGLTIYAHAGAVVVEDSLFRGRPGPTAYRVLAGSRRGVVLAGNVYLGVARP